MSGHSKWSTIKRQKGINDAKRGASFTKMGMAIAIAAREGGGGDPASNFKLRLAMDQARAANMPKENVQRAIDRGLGKGEGASVESVVYEGYGPGKIALVVVAATDNKNRTTPEIRSTIEKSGGTFATPGALSWAFADTGLIELDKNAPLIGVKKTFDEIFEIAVESGADDVEDAGDFVEIYTKPADVEKVKNALVEKGLVPKSVEIIKKPTTLVEVKDAETAKKLITLIEKIEDLDDVQKVYSNFDIPDNLLN